MKSTFSLITLLFAACLVTQANAQQSKQRVSLFDGSTFQDWNGDTENTWRIKDGAIVAGSMDKPAARNEFLVTSKKYSDFDLRLKFKITGTQKINCGVQFRSERATEQDDVPLHEVIGYQADIGDDVHGCLYDESRRNRFLAKPDAKIASKVSGAADSDGWQTYRILAVGDRIQLWINGVQTVDYTESEKTIPQDGAIGLQIHGGMVGTIAYKDVTIQDLSNRDKISIDDFAWIAGHWQGDAMGGSFEETWNPPMAGEMLGMFKLAKDDKVSFYEIMTIVPKSNSFVLRLKHFSEGLVGWEEKNKSVDFPLISVSDSEICFDGLKFIKFDNDSLRIEVVVGKGDKSSTVAFDCKRAKN
ncbi:DUF6265 family protein [Mariniblastus fucicola]|nr:DUF6265 family protein [Mariniblastus fucicola]